MDKNINRDNLISIKIEGNSMYPCIKDQETVLAKELDYRQARTGDILAYPRQKDGKVVVHRLVKKITKSDKALFITQGDANSSYASDCAIDPGQYPFKKVVAILKKDGILTLENKFSQCKGYWQAFLLWYLPFLILPQRKIIKALTRPRLIPKELAKNWHGLAARFRRY